MSVIIIGGGITGLSAAWAFAKSNEQVTLIEPGPLGGLLRTEQIGECIVECGADSWIRKKPWLRDLAIQLGLGDDIIPCNTPKERTTILRHGRLVPIPEGLRMVVPTQWGPIFHSPLFGWRTKLRMVLETRRRPFDIGDRTIAEMVRDHFGQEAVEYLAEPLFAGVYGGAPETLGVGTILPKVLEQERTFGSLIRAAQREPAAEGPIFESMRRGLGQIPEALAAQLRGRVTFIKAAADKVESNRVRVNGDWLSADRIVLACGAPRSADLLAGEECGRLLGTIPHSSATIFAFGFRSAELRAAPRGFGFLVPRRERKTVMAATWVTIKFPHRAPGGHAIIRCFVAGDHTDALIPSVLRDLARIAGITAQPWFSRVYRWPDSLPQYGVGHAKLVERIMASLPPGISVTGAFINGVGMPDCARAGLTVLGDRQAVTRN